MPYLKWIQHPYIYSIHKFKSIHFLALEDLRSGWDDGKLASLLNAKRRWSKPLSLLAYYLRNTLKQIFVAGLDLLESARKALSFPTWTASNDTGYEVVVPQFLNIPYSVCNETHTLGSIQNLLDLYSPRALLRNGSPQWFIVDFRIDLWLYHNGLSNYCTAVHQVRRSKYLISLYSS